MNMVSFGVSGLVLNVRWFPLLGIMLGSSWVWLRLPWSRPLLLIPEVIFAELSSPYAAYMPEMGEWEARAVKQALCHSWLGALVSLEWTAPWSFLIKLRQQNWLPSRGWVPHSQGATLRHARLQIRRAARMLSTVKTTEFRHRDSRWAQVSASISANDKFHVDLPER